MLPFRRASEQDDDDLFSSSSASLTPVSMAPSRERLDGDALLVNENAGRGMDLKDMLIFQMQRQISEDGRSLTQLSGQVAALQAELKRISPPFDFLCPSPCPLLPTTRRTRTPFFRTHVFPVFVLPYRILYEGVFEAGVVFKADRTQSKQDSRPICKPNSRPS